MNRISITRRANAPTINRNIYGHFSEHLGHCIYEGIFVGKDSPIPNIDGIRTDVVEALRRLEIPVLRWPGGCFADEYHWRDGVGEKRRRMVNTNWGGVVEDNSFGTHEFMQLCRLVGCQPYVNANVGSGTVREMAEWVEYLNSDGDSDTVKERWANGSREPFNVKFWGIGNENWGGGGNMRPEYYADVYRQFQTFCRTYGENRLHRIACGPNGDDYNWTEVMMQRAAPFMDALTLHYYTVPKTWEEKGSATEFDYDLYLETLRKASYMDKLIAGHTAIMDRYDPEGRIDLFVDEWGCWFDVEEGTNPGFLYQQNTIRDAMVAAITFNIFNRHCQRVRMANIAQTVNVLQAIILTEGERMLLTPTYHVFDMYRPHMDAKLLDCAVECAELEGGLAAVSASASEKDGVVTVTIANVDEACKLTIGGITAKEFTGRVLSGEPQAHNTFDKPDAVIPCELTSVKLTAEGAEIELPAHSVAVISFK
ncbi:MAG: alpha-N-arabinofuranosidase [Ruminococcaceae bacterium]|nr:alpha-N-arabinofuranosidase [Oscillospiraceae bacterium]